MQGFDFAAPNDWQVVQWGDGRPAAGVLSDSSLWTRFRSPNVNFNRQRANVLSAALLCHDFLDAETLGDSLVVDLTDPEATNEAVTTAASCVGCHQDLDGLAGFFPYEPFWNVATMTFPYPVYAPEYEDEWSRMTGRPPMYFGLGGGDLADLGEHVAADPRFHDCTVRRFYGWFAQVRPEDVPIEVAAELLAGFVDSGFDGAALAREAALHPTLALSHATDPIRAEEVRGVLTATPRQLARTVEALTGFRWEVDVADPCCGATAGSSPYGLVELPTDQYVGYDVVAGGFDGDSVLDPKRTPSVTSALFQQRLAEHAAAWVVDRDSSVLLPGIALDDVDEAHVRSALAGLHLAALGEDVEPDGIEVGETWALWEAVHDRTGSPERAWEVVITAMLRDVRLATY